MCVSELPFINELSFKNLDAKRCRCVSIDFYFCFALVNQNFMHAGKMNVC